VAGRQSVVEAFQAIQDCCSLSKEDNLLHRIFNSNLSRLGSSTFLPMAYLTSIQVL